MSPRVAFSASLTCTPPIPRKATFRGSLGDFPADAGQPSFEGRGFGGRLGGKDRRNLPQIGKRALNGVGWLGSGK